MEHVIGVFSNSRGDYGFVDTERESFFINAKHTKGAMEGDKVKVEVQNIDVPKGKKREARVIDIIERKYKTFIGVVGSIDDFIANIIPCNQLLQEQLTPVAYDITGLNPMDKVLCELLEYPDNDEMIEVTILKNYGKQGDKIAELESIIDEFKLAKEFSQEVLDEGEKVSRKSIIKEMNENHGRRDMRDLNVFTIDGSDAKDLDDAISIERIDGGYRLGVHIADVSEYVKENSKLDREALSRATSVYLVDLVLPMLPEVLSNGVCSLHPNTDKLTLSCIMDIDKKGNVYNYEIIEGLINTNARLTYEGVSKAFEGDKEAIQYHKELGVYDDLLIAKELALILNNKRMKRGALDFQFDEDRVYLDVKGDVVNVCPYPRAVANRIIEEFMLVCNETIAEHFYWLELPFVYRIHENPSPEKLERLEVVLRNMGHPLKCNLDNIRSKNLQQIIEETEKLPEGTIISTNILRSLKQAKYSPQEVGHFGLAAKYYSHFTSPIRRYSDLQIHRIIKEYLHGKLKGNRIEHYEDKVWYSSEQASKMERIADKAEEKVHKYYWCKYMLANRNRIYEGKVYNVGRNSLTILVNNVIKGKILYDSMSSDIEYSEDEFKVSINGIEYKIGDKLNIQYGFHDELEWNLYLKMAE